MLRMRALVVPVAAAAGLGVAVAGGVPAGATVPVKSSSSLTSFHGTVTSVSTANRTFKLRRANGTTRTFRVTSATVYERVGGGLSALRNRAVEVKGKQVDGRWVARKVERDDDASGDDHGGDDNGGGSGSGSGGSGRGGADDGPNHDAGDDHGSGGHGSDD